MPKKLQLDIHQPCYEDWQQMTVSEKGKFCGSCQKQVIDFTGMNDQQLIAFFRKPPTGSVCGRFMSDQLQRDIMIPKKRIPWFKYFFQFALPAFVLSLKAKGQVSYPPVIGDTVISYSDYKIKPDRLIDLKTIKGRVVDNDNNSVSYATIQIGEIAMVADSNGYFMFEKNLLKGVSVIEVSSVGLETKLISVGTILTNKEMLVRMTETKVLGPVELIAFSSPNCGRIIVGGAMSIRSIDIDKWAVANLIPWSISKGSVKVYPNPVRSGNPVTIEVLKSGKQKTVVELFSMTGQVVYSTEINMSSNAWKATAPLPALTAGTYVMRISRGEKEKPYSTKIVIQ